MKTTCRIMRAALVFLAAVLPYNHVSAQTNCTPPPAGLVGWWAGEGNASDSVGGNAGMTEGGIVFVPGEVGQAFGFNGMDADVKIPANPLLDVGLGAGFTIETWIAPSDLSVQRPIVEWNSVTGPVPYGVHFWISVGLPWGSGPGCLYANVMDIYGGEHYFCSPAGLLKQGEYQHVALTLVKTNGTAVMYLNGVAVAEQNLGSFTPQTSSDLYLGYRPAGACLTNRWVGQIDEVSLYNRALSASEIQAVYNAGSSGKCALVLAIAAQPQSQTVMAGGTASFNVVATGTAPLSFQWTFNGSNIVGATDSSLVISNVQPSQAGNYAVIVANAAGSVTSSNAVLIVNAAAPTILSQPQSQSVAVGGTAVFAVTADGGPALTYQWLFNGNGLMGETSSVLVLSNVQPANAGSYSVVVSNAVGGVLSSNALLTVTSPSGRDRIYVGASSAIYALDNSGMPTLFASGLWPRWLGAGSDGSLYAADGYEGLLLSFDPSGVSSQIASNCPGPAVAYDNNGGFYQAQAHRIFKLTSGTWSQLASTPYPKLPITGLTVNTDGNLYGVQVYYGIFRVTQDGSISLVAGDPGLGTAGGMVHDVLGNLFVSYQNTILKVSLDGTTSVFATNGLNYPQGMAFDSEGNLFVANTDDGTIRKFTPDGTASVFASGLDGVSAIAIVQRPVAQPPVILNQPQDWTASVGEVALFSITASGTQPLSYQWQLNGTNVLGATNSSLVLSNVQPAIAGNYAVVVSNAGGSVTSSNALLTVTSPAGPDRIYVGALSGVYELDNSGMPTLFASGLSPRWLGAGSDGSLYAADGYYGLLLRFDPSGVSSQIASNCPGPAVAYDNNGGFYQAQGSFIYKLTSGTWSQFASTPRPKVFITGLTVNTDGNLYGVQGGYGVFRVTQDGSVSLVAGDPGLGTAGGMVHDVSGNLFVSYQVNTILKVSPDGATSVFATNGLNNPQGMAFDSEGNLFVANTGDGTIRKFTPDGTASVFASGLDDVLAIAIVQRPVAQPPVILNQPQDRTVFAGVPATFSVSANSSLPLSYQWRHNDAIIRGATASFLVLSNVQPADAGSYSVVVSNAAGSVVSSNALLTVLTSPVITVQPQSQTAYLGGSVTFSITATNALSYQWYKDDGRIPGATGTSLVLTNLQLADAGVYSVIVSNLDSVAMSSGAVLTVMPPPSCTPTPSGLVSWWAGEGNCLDSVGGNNGTPYNGVTCAAGEVGQAFVFDGTAGHIRIPDSPALRFSKACTFEAWVNPSLNAAQCIITKWDMVFLPAPQKSYSFYLNPDGRLYLALSPSGSDESKVVVVSSNTVPVGAWTHVAGTYDGATVKVYLNGSLEGAADWISNIYPGTNDLAIGGNVGGGSPGEVNGPFAGMIDEPTIYARALSASEIQAIYNAGSSGKCASSVAPTIVAQPQGRTVFAGGTVSFTVTAAGTVPLLYQWQKDGTNVPGATGASVVLTGAQLADAGAYSVVVSNIAGVVVSSNAVLTVLPVNQQTFPGTGTDVGAPLLAGFVTTNGDGTLTIVGGGSDIWGNSDQFYYYYTSVTGRVWDVVFQARSFIGPDPWSKCGLMVRKPDLAAGVPGAGDAYIDIITTPPFYTDPWGDMFTNYTPLEVQYRAEQGQGSLVAGQVPGVYAPVWLRLSRFGSQFTMSWAPDGVNWAPVASLDTAAAGGEFGAAWPEVLLVGIAVTAHNDWDPTGAIAVLSDLNLAVTQVPDPTAFEVSEQLQSVAAYPGSEASFRFVTTNNAIPPAPASYQWYKKGLLVPGAVGENFSFPASPEDDGAEVYCVASLPGTALAPIASATAHLTVPTGQFAYGLREEFYPGSSRTAIENGNIGSPAMRRYLPGLECTVNSGQNYYARRISGWFIPPVTGNYVFFVASDDDSDLFLSTDESPDNKRLIAQQGSWGYPRAWTSISSWSPYEVSQKRSDQWSPDGGLTVPYAAGLPLTAGKGYFLEMIHHQDYGLDNCAATYKLLTDPDPLDGDAPLLQASNHNVGLYTAPAHSLAFASQPQGVSVIAGQVVTLAAVAATDSEFPPLYQWYRNGEPLPGVTGTSYQFTADVYPDAGEYFVVAQTAAGGLSVTSSVATVSVNPTACVPKPDGLIGWWRAEGTANDDVGGSQGILQNGAFFTPGVAGSAFNLRGYQFVQAPWTQPCPGGQSEFTIELWANFSDTNSIRPFVSQGWWYIPAPGWSFQWANGRLLFHIDDGGQDIGQIPFSPVPGKWYHVAVTRSASGDYTFFVDGAPVGAASDNRPVLNPGTELLIGLYWYDAYFVGALDEVSFYSRALPSDTIAAIHAAWRAGKCAPPPGAAVPYSTSFESGIGPEWSNPAICQADPSTPFTAFSGPFNWMNPGPQSLTLNSLVPGRRYAVTLDFYPIDGWYGNSWGNYLDITVHGASVFRETFYNFLPLTPGTDQSYPRRPDVGPAQLGFDPSYFDSIYRNVTAYFTASSEVEMVTFSGQVSYLGAWGIDNVSVHPVPPPVISGCPQDIVVANDPGVCGATVTWTEPTAADNGTPVPVVSDHKPGEFFPVGTTTVTYTAAGVQGIEATRSFKVTVEDREKPVIEGLAATPGTLWPPNHGMLLVTVNYTTRDNCGVASVSLSATSNEPDSGLGDGDLPQDIQLVPGDAQHLYLRAERWSDGPGRVYTITVTSTDIHGNTATATVPVRVPHDEGI